MYVLPSSFPITVLSYLPFCPQQQFQQSSNLLHNFLKSISSMCGAEVSMTKKERCSDTQKNLFWETTVLIRMFDISKPFEGTLSSCRFQTSSMNTLPSFYSEDYRGPKIQLSILKQIFDI